MRVDKQRRNNNINTRKLGSRYLTLILSVASVLAMAIPVSSSAVEIETPAVALAGVPMDYAVDAAPPGELVNLRIDGKSYSATANDDGRAEFSEISIASAGRSSLLVTVADETLEKQLRVIPGWVSVMPAVFAIVIALTLRNLVRQGPGPGRRTRYGNRNPRGLVDRIRAGSERVQPRSRRVSTLSRILTQSAAAGTGSVASRFRPRQPIRIFSALQGAACLQVHR